MSGRAFVLANSVLIVGFALGGLLAPEPFWRLLGVDPVNPLLARLMAWYLGTFGLGGLIAARAPEKHPLVVGLLGFEKIGAAATFFACLGVYGFNPLLAGVGAFDAVMAVLLLRYARSLWRA
jgi:hypothetical protein